MKILFLIPISIFFLSCKDRSANETKSSSDSIVNTSNEIIHVTDTLSGVELKRLLNLDVDEVNEYVGEYSFNKGNDNKKILNGSFKFSHNDSTDSKALITGTTDSIDLGESRINKTIYSGHFVDNKKEGKFIKRYRFYDGVDWGEDYVIELEFRNDICASAKFIGTIGFAMPKSTYQFQNLNECSFYQIRKLAWKNWELEYGKRNSK